ncbi:nuclear transcription factor y subunit b-5 [Phtheirospermum japonicum]|uniref:Nuclear transcription factor y subunit b-5 n=1 Tax=Phtheirospermum japonicum TaxID=374723 RepID=A0A830BDF6_9LAMI|nr:nuclear transcription factor y subunit b-5 [Phtheirospermum japonicum]
MKEHDCLLPIANVGRIMKQILPSSAKISKEAKETMQECVSEFISFVTCEASHKCHNERRKTVNGDDICWSLMNLGFDEYSEAMKRYLVRYREAEDERANLLNQRPDESPSTFGNFAPENHDSDQSISEDEEDLEGERTGNAISLDGSRNNKDAMKVMSQLEILRDSYEFHSSEKGTISSHERKGGYHMDDEVEISLSDEGDGSRHYPRITHTKPNEGMIYVPTMTSISHSDEEKTNPPTLRRARENVDSTWSEASREVEALVCLNENPSCPSSHGGGGGKKFKPKFVFRQQSMVVSDRHGRASSDNSPPTDEIGGEADEEMDEFMAESQLIYHDKESEQPENHIFPFEPAHKHDSKGHSMADFLYSFEESSKQLQGNSGNPDEDDTLEALDSGSPSCSDDEENHQNLKLVMPTRTMADQFHEAFGTVAVIDERPHLTFSRSLCNGMYGKLQQVMQSEKERDMGYLKSPSSETGFKDERMCISVRILTRALEAKLIVCSCSRVEDGKNSCMDSNFQMNTKDVVRTLTIIFNPRICSDVELEIGNLICIRSPWREVQVKGKNDVIYLCSYFTHVQP